MSSKKIDRLAAIAILVLVVIAALVGCGPSKSHTSQAKASISALAKNPKVVAAEARWKPIVENCATQQHHWIMHPVRAIEGTATCATKDLTPAQKAQAKTCIETGLLHAGLKTTKDEAVLIGCLAKASPNGPGTHKAANTGKKSTSNHTHKAAHK